MIMSDIVIIFVLTFMVVRGESCRQFRSTENIAIDPNTCRMEISLTEDWIHRCVKECDKNSQVRCVKIFKTVNVQFTDPSNSVTTDEKQHPVILVRYKENGNSVEFSKARNSFFFT